MINLSDFSKWLQIRYAAKTAYRYFTCMKQYFNEYSELTQENIESYLFNKLQKWSTGTRNIFIKALKTYCEYKNINMNIPSLLKEERKPRKYITEDELNNILLKIPLIFPNGVKIQTILKLMFYTGIRPKEVLDLKRNNFDFKTDILTLTQTKTKKMRKIKLSQDLHKMIPIIFAQEPEISNAFNLTSSTITYIFNTINQALNLDINPYMMRNSFAHFILKKSRNDLRSLQKLLGHAKIDTTMIYIDIAEQELLEKMDKWLK